MIADTVIIAVSSVLAVSLLANAVAAIIICRQRYVDEIYSGIANGTEFAKALCTHEIQIPSSEFKFCVGKGMNKTIFIIVVKIVL